jgi:hypothetical protein
MRILFILKERFYANTTKTNKSYGLMNSARQVAEYLETLGHECKLAQVIDGNFIDKEVYHFKPDVVIIEALWVTGDKLKELIELKRYKNIKWIVRVHSDIGFLAAETMALKYVDDYIEMKKENLFISMNNYTFNEHIGQALQHEFVYLPNIITIKDYKIKKQKIKNHIDIACFGSLRILKNQCYQALCAMEMANRLNKKLKFHVTVDIGMDDTTSNRYPVLKNLEEMFRNSRHELVKHAWLENQDFHHLVKEMDIGMQVSYTESFNIVAADFVNHNIPIVVSDAVKWMPFIFKTSTVDYEKTIRKLLFMYKHRNSKFLIKWAKFRLELYNETAKTHWREFISQF